MEGLEAKDKVLIKTTRTLDNGIKVKAIMENYKWFRHRHRSRDSDGDWNKKDE